MFSRFFLGVLSVISLTWIIIVGYDLLDKNDFITPERIFKKTDGEILIVNRSEEVHLESLSFKIHPKVKAVYEKLLLNVYQNEQIYTTVNRPLILVAQTKVWTLASVSNYFSVKGITIQVKEGKNFDLGNGMQGRYKRNFLLIHPKGEEVNPGEEMEWPLWDTKASASIIQLSNPLKSTNIYFKADGTVSYQTKYGPKLTGSKLYDEDLFAQLVPSKVENYHFLEKEYAIQIGILPKNSPLANWMESGMVCFDYEGTACIISDYLKMQDPIQVLTTGTELDPDDMHVSDVQLITGFPSDVQKGFYVSMLADKVLLSEDKTVLDRILADYEIGNTLALNQEKMNRIFGRLPKKVSERVVSKSETHTLSAYKYLLITTQLAAEQTAVAETEKTEEQNNRSFSLSGSAEHILGNADLTYCFTSNNQVLAYKNKKQLWRVQIDGKVIGNPKLIDLYRNGNQQLLFNTATKIYLLNNQGGNVSDFPMTCESHAPVNSYRWNNKTYFVLVNSGIQLLHIDEQGRLLKKIALKTGEVRTEVNVSRPGTVLTAFVNGSEKMQTVDLTRNKVLKTMNQIPAAELALKEANAYRFYAEENGYLVGTDLTGTERKIGLAGITKVKKLYRGDEAFLCAFSKTGVALVFADGSNKTIETGIVGIDDVDVLYTSNGTMYLAVLDGIENNIYLLDASGKKSLDQSFEGKKMVKLNESNGRLILSTVLQNSLVQYYDVLRH